MCVFVNNMSDKMFCRLRGRKDSCVERREWNEGGVVGWEAHGAHHMSAVQPQIYDLRQRLLQHGEGLKNVNIKMKELQSLNPF